MKKFLLASLAVLLLAVGAGWLFREPLFATLVGALTADMFVQADTDAFDPGVPVGAELPPLRALYDGREINDIARLSGPSGLVLVANRSADWCPYCMAQYVQLHEHYAAFQEAGIEIVALTYDAPALQQKFIDAHAIDYPFLSDIEASSVRALGILNTEYAPGDRAYGIPYPGIFIVNPEGVIVGKIFIDGYEKRVQAGAVLDYASDLLGSSD
tara:strand:+ start:24493 stop:25131 length:639 start_codon:yes stop_codon:yes gene_type:complete